MVAIGNIEDNGKEKAELRADIANLRNATAEHFNAAREKLGEFALADGVVPDAEEINHFFARISELCTAPKGGSATVAVDRSEQDAFNDFETAILAALPKVRATYEKAQQATGDLLQQATDNLSVAQARFNDGNTSTTPDPNDDNDKTISNKLASALGNFENAQQATQIAFAQHHLQMQAILDKLPDGNEKDTLQASYKQLIDCACYRVTVEDEDRSHTTFTDRIGEQPYYEMHNRAMHADDFSRHLSFMIMDEESMTAFQDYNEPASNNRYNEPALTPQSTVPYVASIAYQTLSNATNQANQALHTISEQQTKLATLSGTAESSGMTGEHVNSSGDSETQRSR